MRVVAAILDHSGMNEVVAHRTTLTDRFTVFVVCCRKIEDARTERRRLAVPVPGPLRARRRRTVIDAYAVTMRASGAPIEQLAVPTIAVDDIADSDLHFTTMQNSFIAAAIVSTAPIDNANVRRPACARRISLALPMSKLARKRVPKAKGGVAAPLSLFPLTIEVCGIAPGNTAGQQVSAIVSAEMGVNESHDRWMSIFHPNR